jgi:thioesterase domain-containing protein
VVAPGLEYQALTRHLGVRQPVFGIEVPNLEETPAPDTIEGIASECVATLRRFRPHGPYALCGWCMAGVIAYEMAQQLEAQGEEVPLLSLIDARDFFAPAPSGPARWLFSIERLMQRARHRFRQVLAARGSEKLRLVSGMVARALGRLTPARFGRTQEQASIAALHRYRPRPWNGPLVHIWARERAAGSHSDVEYCWGHLAHGGIVFREVPGDHHSVFHEPNARVLAQHIAEQLQALEPKTTAAYAGAALALRS